MIIAWTFRPRIKSATGGYGICLTEIRNATEGEQLLYETRKLSTRSSQLVRIGEYGQALPLAIRAAEIGEKTLGPEDAYAGYLLGQLGRLYSLAGDYRKGEVLLERALAIDEKALGVDHPQTLQALGALGVSYSNRGDYPKAAPLLHQALETSEKTLGAEDPEVAWRLVDLSRLDVDTRDLESTKKDLERALAIAQKTLDGDGGDDILISILNNLGLAYVYDQDYGHAKPLLSRAVEIGEKAFGPDCPRLALPLQNLAQIAQENQADFPKALELYSRAEHLLEKDQGAENVRVAAILNNMANIYKSMGQYPKALELHQHVYSILEKQLGPYHRSTFICLGNMARTYAASGDIANAINYQARTDEAIEMNLSLNLGIGSERQKLAYFDSLSGRTDRTISLSVQLAPYDQSAADLAALVVLQRKGRVLDAMSRSLSALRERLNDDDRKLLDELNATTAQFANLALNGAGPNSPDEFRRRLAELEERKEKLEAEVSARSAEFRAQAQPVTLASIKAAIPSDAALIEFMTYSPFDPKTEATSEKYGELRYVAYVLHQQGEVKWKDLGPAKDIDATVDAFRQALRDPLRKDIGRLARATDEKVVQPVCRLLGASTQLLISPDGDLNLIPFEALVDEQGHYLVQRFSLSYLTSGRDLLRTQIARLSAAKPLVIADPFFGEPGTAPAERANPGQLQPSPTTGERSNAATREDLSSIYFPPLRGTAQEASAIKALFPEAKVLVGREATKSALRQADAPQILHIATHGFFLPEAGSDSQQATGPAISGSRAIHATVKIENPLLRSGLALAGANLNKGAGTDDDGILTASEASSLNLWGTKLVTLSACETGLGEVKTGEGVYGLRRAFFLAGAETLVMSLWSVSDYTTREMMTGYYAGLKRGLGRGDALRQAQLAMMKRPGRQHPFFWASFIQSGEWANLDGKR